MTAQFASPTTAPTTISPVPTLLDADDPVEAARQHIADGALRATDGPPRQVGLELELHLVEFARPAARPSWDTVQRVVAALPPMPSGSSVTTEPGGQLELSTPPAFGAAASVAALQADRDVLRTALAGLGFGAAPIGADPARLPKRVNPTGRYAAMEQHFAAVGCAGPGLAMMTATAALQVNLDAGPQAGWSQRLGLIRTLGPVLVAASGCSPWLGGSTSGWASMRQQAWHGIDHSRSDPVDGDDPAQAWATYALEAAVMLVRDGEHATPVTERVPFRAWLQGRGPIHRPPTDADLAYHLTTLFPPVRPRGYIEIRCLDAAPDRWWPALAGLVATLLDDPVAADAAAEAAEPVRDAWNAAARAGVHDAALRHAAVACAAVATERCEPALRADLTRLTELLDSGCAPGDELRERAERVGPLAVLTEEAHA